MKLVVKNVFFHNGKEFSKGQELSKADKEFIGESAGMELVNAGCLGVQEEPAPEPEVLTEEPSKKKQKSAS